MKVFELSNQAEAKAETWIEQHKKEKCGMFDRPMRGEITESPITYTFTDSSIGTLASVSCECGKSELINFEDL